MIIGIKKIGLKTKKLEHLDIENILYSLIRNLNTIALCQACNVTRSLQKYCIHLKTKHRKKWEGMEYRSHFRTMWILLQNNTTSSIKPFVLKIIHVKEVRGLLRLLNTNKFFLFTVFLPMCSSRFSFQSHFIPSFLILLSSALT